MEWQGAWEDPFTTYLTHFEGLIGDARTRTTFAETVKGIIAAGSLVCQRIAAQSPVLAALQNGAQRIIRMVMGKSTKRSPHLDAADLTATLRTQAVEHLGSVPADEVWLIADMSELGTQEQLCIPNSRRRTDNVNEPFVKVCQTLQVCFYPLHCLLGKLDACCVAGRDDLHDRMLPFPGHTRCELQHGLHRIEQAPVPMVLQNPPTAFHGIVLAVIGRIVRQAQRQPRLLGKRQQPQHELRPPAVVLWPVVEIDHQRRDVGKPLPHPLPPLLQLIHQAVTRHFAGHQRQKKLIRGWQ